VCFSCGKRDRSMTTIVITYTQEWRRAFLGIGLFIKSRKETEFYLFLTDPKAYIYEANKERLRHKNMWIYTTIIYKLRCRLYHDIDVDRGWRSGIMKIKRVFIYFHLLHFFNRKSMTT
jgi:hypothetical protein